MLKESFPIVEYGGAIHDFTKQAQSRKVFQVEGDKTIAI
jgi:hypothetical protein